MCGPKGSGGLGFRNFGIFNISLLVKQGWRSIQNPNSLLAQVLKAKYNPNSDFLNSELESGVYYSWMSFWASKKSLFEGVCWRVGNNEQISVQNSAWVMGSNNYRLVDSIYINHLDRVIDLINPISRVWREELVTSVFGATDAERILRIPLAVVPHEDAMVSQHDPSGEFTIRSAYKLLYEKSYSPSYINLQTNYSTLYKKILNTTLP